MPSLTTSVALRLIVVVGLLAGFDHVYGRELIELLMPLLRWELGWLDDNYRILRLGIETGLKGSDSVIRLDITQARFVVIGPRVMAPNPGITMMATTATGTVLRPLIIGLAVLAVWPASRRIQYVWRFAIGVPLLLAILPVDVPLMLLGSLWEVMQFYSKTNEFSPLIAWKKFLQGGGPMALAFCMALGAIIIGKYLAPPLEKPVADSA